MTHARRSLLETPNHTAGQFVAAQPKSIAAAAAARETSVSGAPIVSSQKHLRPLASSAAPVSSGLAWTESARENQLHYRRHVMMGVAGGAKKTNRFSVLQKIWTCTLAAAEVGRRRASALDGEQVSRNHAELICAESFTC